MAILSTQGKADIATLRTALDTGRTALDVEANILAALRTKPGRMIVLAAEVDDLLMAADTKLHEMEQRDTDQVINKPRPR